ncbi:TPA: hypothetical protein ENS27_06245 [bacterium]|mgnify:CR=1 FL=1|nr:hypothetical protein [bacterium]
MSVEPSMFIDKFDLAVIGEGEQTALEIVENYCNGKDYRNIDGIAFREGEKIVYTKPRKALDKLDCLPFPSRELYPNDNYKSVILGNI